MEVTDEENELLWQMERRATEMTLRSAKLIKNTQDVKTGTMMTDVCKVLDKAREFIAAYEELQKIRETNK